MNTEKAVDKKQTAYGDIWDEYDQELDKTAQTMALAEFEALEFLRIHCNGGIITGVSFVENEQVKFIEYYDQNRKKNVIVGLSLTDRYIPKELRREKQRVCEDYAESCFTDYEKKLALENYMISDCHIAPHTPVLDALAKRIPARLYELKSIIYDEEEAK